MIKRTRDLFLVDAVGIRKKQRCANGTEDGSIASALLCLGFETQGDDRHHNCVSSYPLKNADSKGRTITLIW